MDIQKTFLYLGLFLVSLMLWDSWHKDHAVKTTPTQQASSSLPSTIETASQTTVQAPIAESIPSERLVHVRTDVLDVTIDKKGGNIISAKLLQYPKTLNSKLPYELLNNNKESFYVSQSGLIGEKGPDTKQKLAEFTTENNSYELGKSQKQLNVKLNWRDNKGVTATKTYTFKRDDYLIDVDYQISNQSNETWNGQLYSQIQRKKPEKKSAMFDFHTYVGASVSSPEKRYEKVSFKKMQSHDLDRTVKDGWAAMQQRYFLSAWIPKKEEIHRYYTHTSSGDIYTVGILGPNLSLAPGNTQKVGAKFYVGPEVAERLKAIATGLDLTVDFGWLWFISIGIFWFMQKIYNVVGNWGWAIVLVTLSIKAVFYKLSAKSYYSMANMRKLQPRIEALKARYGDDKQQMGVALMDLYKKEKVNPLGGCLPILVQIPVFLSLYWVLIESVELRHSPFIFWITDLSSKDPYFVLPILMGLSMLLQQKLSPPPPDPMQAKVMMFLPVFFTILFLGFPAGLVLYWLVNNLLSVSQQWYVLKKVG